MVIHHVEPLGIILIVGGIDEHLPLVEMSRGICRENIFNDRVVRHEARGGCRDNGEYGENLIHAIDPALMSFDKINRIARMLYKALDATEVPLVFSCLSL